MGKTCNCEHNNGLGSHCNLDNMCAYIRERDTLKAEVERLVKYFESIRKVSVFSEQDYEECFVRVQRIATKALNEGKE